MDEIKRAIRTAAKKLFGESVEPELTRPDEQFGDYATNVALQLAGKLHKKPHEVANKLAHELTSNLAGKVEAVTVAGPGFINMRLTDSALLALIGQQPHRWLRGQTVVAEYSDPNPFKVLHAGHLYTSIVGDAIANLLEAAGATVHRVNYGGDVGLHVGKTMWAMIQSLGGENPDKLKEIAPDKRAEWMAEAYIRGTLAYEDDPAAKVAIIEYNKRVYELHATGDQDSAFAQIYWTTRQWSYDYFNQFYERIGSRFEKFYPESSVARLGAETVRQQLAKGVFEKSDGAVIFKGEAHGLHTRVFINSEGIPTYEAKDIGLVMTKWQDYRFDRSIIITGNEQAEYMAVVLKALEQFKPDLAKVTTHVTHGIVKLKGGVKMSSRRGNILRATDVLDVAAEASQKATGKANDETVLGAVKYALLKHRIGGDIIYDPDESVSILGNSGPYLQYAHARARSILKKSSAGKAKTDKLEKDERSLVRKISEFAEVEALATKELMPHHICSYLYELAQSFNRFYERNRVIGDPREGLRRGLVEAYANVLRSGLDLLNIPAPEHI